eukprot:scaffold33958_cov28-Tisochrysis_lutea.AAC.1
MLQFSGLAGSDGAAPTLTGDGSARARTAAAAARRQAADARLLMWRHDGAHAAGPPFAFESAPTCFPTLSLRFDPASTGPGSLDAFVRACRDEPYYNGAGATEGLKTVATIDALYRSIQSGKSEMVSGCTDI